MILVRYLLRYLRIPTYIISTEFGNAKHINYYTYFACMQHSQHAMPVVCFCCCSLATTVRPDTENRRLCGRVFALQIFYNEKCHKYIGIGIDGNSLLDPYVGHFTCQVQTCLMMTLIVKSRFGGQDN